MFRTKSNLKIQLIMKYSNEEKFELLLCVLYTIAILGIVFFGSYVFGE